MKPKALHTLLVASSLALASAGAAADQFTTEATRTGLTLSVIDLTPDDGVAAGYSYRSTYANYFLELQFSGQPDSTITHTDAGGPANLRLEENGSFLELSADTLGDWSLRGSVRPGAGSHRVGGIMSIVSFIDLTLAPNTAIVMTGAMTQSLTRDGGVTGWGNGRTEIKYKSLGEGPWGSLIYDIEWDKQGVKEFADDIYLTFANASDHDMLVSLDMRMSMYGGIAAVPEPSTYGLLLGGMAVIAGAVRRTRRAGAAAVKEG